MKEQERLQLELRIELETAEEFNGNLAECQEYLRETKPEEQWDCETILTTYSTLDNHPTVIKDTNSKFRPYKSRYERYKEKEEERNANRLVKQQSEQKKKIVLTGKYGLPEGYGKSAATGKSRSKEESKAKIVKSCETVEEKDTEEDGDEDAEDEGSDESKNSDSYEDSVSTSIVKRKSQESKEAKKLRKAEVKKERQEKRSAKKEMKLAFSNEGKKMKKVLANEQSIDRVSVFKY